MPGTPSDEVLVQKLQRILTLAKAQLWAVRMGDPEAFERLTLEREKLQEELSSLLATVQQGEDRSADCERNLRLLLLQIKQADQQCMAEGEKLREATRRALKDTQAYLDWSRWHRNPPRPPIVDTLG